MIYYISIEWQVTKFYWTIKAIITKDHGVNDNSLF